MLQAQGFAILAVLCYNQMAESSHALGSAPCFWQITLLPRDRDLVSICESAPELHQTFSLVHQAKQNPPTKYHLCCFHIPPLDHNPSLLFRAHRHFAA